MRRYVHFYGNLRLDDAINPAVTFNTHNGRIDFCTEINT